MDSRSGTWHWDDHRLFSARTYPIVEDQDMVLILGSQGEGEWIEDYPDDNSTHAPDVNWVRVWQ
jgi:hypothetical protein